MFIHKLTWHDSSFIKVRLFFKVHLFSKVNLFSHISPKTSYMFTHILTCYLYVYNNSSVSITTSFHLGKTLLRSSPFSFFKFHSIMSPNQHNKFILGVNIEYHPLIHQNSNLTSSMYRIGACQPIPEAPETKCKEFLALSRALGPIDDQVKHLSVTRLLAPVATPALRKQFKLCFSSFNLPLYFDSLKLSFVSPLELFVLLFLSIFSL